ncbi:MAG: Do family serine endopeptidase [candidate division Zixibacteria bacterium]|nr:Do family serine endopeptidase [candidate division Zixibacteria bacterium]
MADEIKFKKSFLLYSLSSLLFIIVGIIIASGLSLPDALTADEPQQSEVTQAELVNEVLPITSDGHSPFVQVAARIKDAVVNISAESIKEGTDFHNFGLDDDFFRRFFGVPRDNTPQPRRSQSLGSGFIISKDGYIITNNHVVQDADQEKGKVFVKLSDTSEYEAEIVGRDPETDIALLKIDSDDDLTVARFGDSDEILVGDWSMAIGNPFPQLGLDRTVTVGVISATGRKGLMFGGSQVSYQDYIQTDAAINRGNSGGPLVNIKGEVIGINSAIASVTGGSVGIGFAIPINMAKPVVEALKATGQVSRGWLGVRPGEITPDLAEGFNLPNTEGVLVEEVIKDSPAEESGFKAGDIILRFDGKKVTDLHQFRFLVAETPPFEEVEVDVLREGKRKDLGVTLGDRSVAMGNLQDITPGRAQGPNNAEWMGITVRTFTRTMAERMGIDWEPGVLVTDVEVGSSADRKGLNKDDVILEINGETVENTQDFMEIAEKLEGRTKAIPFFVRSGGSTRFIAIKPER